MFYSQKPVKILLITVVAMIAATTSDAQQAASKKALPDFKFENKSYQVDCYDKTKGGCEQLIELLKSFQRPKEKVTPKQWDGHIRNA